MYEVTAWAETKESWSVDAGEIMGDTSDEVTWAKLDELLARTFPGTDGSAFPIAMMAIDPATTRSRSTTTRASIR